MKNIELITKQIELVAIQLKIIKVAIDNITKQIKSVESRFRFRTDKKKITDLEKTEELIHHSRYNLEYWKKLLPKTDWNDSKENSDAAGIKLEADKSGTNVRIYNIAALIEVYHHEFISKKVQIKIKSLLEKRSYWEAELRKEKSDLYKVLSVMKKDIGQVEVKLVALVKCCTQKTF